MKKIYSIRQNMEMAKKISEKSKIPIGNYEISNFVDSEIYVKLNDSVIDTEAIVIGSTNPPTENIIELIILIDTLKINGAKIVDLINPYYGYSRSDHIVPEVSSSISAKMFMKVFEALDVTTFSTIEMHHPDSLEYFSISHNNLETVELFVKAIKNEEKSMKSLNNYVIASPDAGGVSRAKNLSQLLSVEREPLEVVEIHKHRPKADEVEFEKMIGDVRFKDVYIVDDMIQTGNTIILAVNKLKEQGANRVFVLVTHMVYSANSLKKLSDQENIQKVFITDTVPLPKGLVLPSKFEIISVVDLLSKYINTII